MRNLFITAAVFLLVLLPAVAEFYIGIDARLIGDETTLQSVVDTIGRELDIIDDVTVLDATDQATIILRFNISEAVTEAGAACGIIIHMAVLVPFQSSNAGRQLLYIADDMGGAPLGNCESLIRGMIEDLDNLLESSRNQQ